MIIKEEKIQVSESEWITITLDKDKSGYIVHVIEWFRNSQKGTKHGKESKSSDPFLTQELAEKYLNEIVKKWR
jgi:hypothetical protein